MTCFLDKIYIRFNIQMREIGKSWVLCQLVCGEKYGASSQEWKGR